MSFRGALHILVVGLLLMLLALACYGQGPPKEPYSLAPSPQVIAAQNAITTAQQAVDALIQQNQLPAVIGLGISYNPSAGAGTNFVPVGFGLYPLSEAAGIYASTAADVLPIKKTIDGKSRWTVQFSMRQGIHKRIYQRDKFVFLLGGAGGYAISQASPTGLNATGAADLTGTVVYMFKPKMGIAAPIRGIWVPTVGWDFVPQVSFVLRL